MTYHLTVTSRSGTELVNLRVDSPRDVIIETLRNLVAHSGSGRTSTAVTAGEELLWFCNWDLSAYSARDRADEIKETARTLVAEVHWHADYTAPFTGLVQVPVSCNNHTC